MFLWEQASKGIFYGSVKRADGSPLINMATDLFDYPKEIRLEIEELIYQFFETLSEENKLCLARMFGDKWNTSAIGTSKDGESRWYHGPSTFIDWRDLVEFITSEQGKTLATRISPYKELAGFVGQLENRKLPSP